MTPRYALVALLLIGGCSESDPQPATTPTPTDPEPAPPAAEVTTVKPVTPVTPKEKAEADPGAGVALGPPTAPEEVFGPPVPGADLQRQMELLSPGTDETKLQGHRVITEMTAAYRDAPTFVERMMVSQFVGQKGTGVGEIVITAGKGTDARITSSSIEVTAIGDRLYMTTPAVLDKYVDAPLHRNLLATVRDAMGLNIVATHGLDARYGFPRTFVLNALSFGMPGVPEVHRYSRIESDEGEPLDRVVLLSERGLTVVDIDVETRFLRHVESVYSPENAPANMENRLLLTFETTVADELDPPLTFDPDGRRAVDTFQALKGIASSDSKLRVNVGDEAPDFEEFTLSGTPVKLSELRGQVVILMFWAKRDPTSQNLILEAVPALTAFVSEQDGITLLPCNTTEAGQDEGERHVTADDWWIDQSIPGESLFDGADRIARRWGVDAVPNTVVIDPEGRITAILPGRSPGIVDRIKQAALDARSE